MFRIKVVDGGLRGVGNVPVKLEFCAEWPDVAGIGWTDEEGFVVFEGFEDGEVEVHVNGRGCGVYEYRNGYQLTVRTP